MKEILSIVSVTILVMVPLLLMNWDEESKPSETANGWAVLGYPPIEDMMLLSGHEFVILLGEESKEDVVHINWADKQMIQKLKAFIDSIKIKKIDKNDYIDKPIETVYIHVDWDYYTKNKKHHICNIQITDQYVLIGEQVYEAESPVAPAAKILFDELKIIEQKIQDEIEEEEYNRSNERKIDKN